MLVMFFSPQFRQHFVQITLHADPLFIIGENQHSMQLASLDLDLADIQDSLRVHGNLVAAVGFLKYSEMTAHVPTPCFDWALYPHRSHIITAATPLTIGDWKVLQ
jgi:hypothetical protein